MQKFTTVIIGGGASGIVAAISARRAGHSVLICEKSTRLGKKLLASGAGRCNILNEGLNESFYDIKARKLVKSVFSRFGKDSLKEFFTDLGLVLYSQGSRVFPVTNQSSSVLRALEAELKRLSVQVEFDFEVSGIEVVKEGFSVISIRNKRVFCDKLIIASGGRSYPVFGADGGGYELAVKFGHSIITPVPSAVPLVVKDSLCHLLQGQKIFADAQSLIDGKIAEKASGEVIFTKYGLSGTAILDVSESVSIAINRQKKKDVSVAIDMAPFLNCQDLKQELLRRRERGFLAQDLLVGIVPNKLVAAYKDLSGKKDVDMLVHELKNKIFSVSGTRGWNEAEFTCGGVDVEEVRESNLESRLRKGLYLAGEILDVRGKRGGYNLAWAWASGLLAGLTE